ncbi:hypothetical protein [Vibrio sp. TRT 29B02]|uniref:hypothetical protein n=1 Tax=Vibrio sp. TRT 29B02 TaxID=3418508 RepID=UPI003CEF6A22
METMIITKAITIAVFLLIAVLGLLGSVFSNDRCFAQYLQGLFRIGLFGSVVMLWLASV